MPTGICCMPVACATWIHMNPHDHTWSRCHICHEKAPAMTRRGATWGPLDSQVWCLRRLQNQAVTTRSGSSLGTAPGGHALRHAMCSIEEIWRNHRGGAWVSGLWMVTPMFEAQVAQVHSGSGCGSYTYRMTHKLRTSQCVKMTAWEASGRCWDIEPGLTLKLGWEGSHDPIPWSISPMGEYRSNRFQYISRD